MAPEVIIFPLISEKKKYIYIYNPPPQILSLSFSCTMNRVISMHSERDISIYI